MVIMGDTEGRATDPNQADAPTPTSGTAGPTGAGSTTDAPLALTQADLNALISRRLAESRASVLQELRAQYGDLDALKKAADELAQLKAADMTDLERAQQALADKQAELERKEKETQEAKLHALRLEVGQTKGLSPLLASRLTGETREALETDADAVLAELGPRPRPTPPNLDATAGMQHGEGGSHSSKLTPGELAAAKAARMTPDEYMQAKLQMEQGQKQG
jgi:hypothetical protein